MTPIEIIDGNLEQGIRKLQRWFNQHVKKELQSREGFEPRPQRRKRKSYLHRKRLKRMLRRRLTY